MARSARAMPSRPVRREGTRRARIKQATLRQVTEALLSEQRLDALVYPTLRRRPARIGDAQAGTNCQLSAHSGLPSLSVPAGFTTDGVPIAMELLGAPLTESQLLSLGYGIEQTLKLRKAPFSVPALVGGKPPAPRTTTLKGAGLSIALTYDVTTSRVDYTVTPEPKAPLTTTVIWLHTGTSDKPGRRVIALPRRPRPARGQRVRSRSPLAIVTTWKPVTLCCGCSQVPPRPSRCLCRKCSAGNEPADAARRGRSVHDSDFRGQRRPHEASARPGAGQPRRRSSAARADGGDRRVAFESRRKGDVAARLPSSCRGLRGCGHVGAAARGAGARVSGHRLGQLPLLSGHGTGAVPLDLRAAGGASSARGRPGLAPGDRREAVWTRPRRPPASSIASCSR